MSKNIFYDLIVEHLENICDAHMMEKDSDIITEMGANIDDNVFVTFDVTAGDLHVYSDKCEVATIKKNSPLMQALNFLYKQLTYDCEKGPTV